MKYILTSNSLEHFRFPSFIQAAGEAFPDAQFILTGDLLNIFPEPGEDLGGSIFAEIFGDMIFDEMDRLVRTGFKNPADSSFVPYLKQLFYPTGDFYEKGKQVAYHRYVKLFSEFQKVLGHHQFFYIPGNMDYPQLAAQAAQGIGQIMQLDWEVMVKDGVKIAGLGGIPHSAHPFKGVADISPYELADEEYGRRLQTLKGVDVLLTHVSPEESDLLKNYIECSSLKMLICRAPFDFSKEGDYRGALECSQFGNTPVIKVRPFDYPTNEAIVIDLTSNQRITLDNIEIFQWQDEEVDSVITNSALSCS